MAAPFSERNTEPTLENYQVIVERQSHLYGCITGLCAIAVGADRDAVRRAEAIGRTFYEYEQFIGDRNEYDSGDDDPWNLWHLASESDAVDHLLERRKAIEPQLATLPEERATAIRALFAQDLEAWLDIEVPESES